MNQPSRVMFKFSGSIFTLVVAMLFYNHLFTAAQNPGFYVVVFFNVFGEGNIELLIFLCFMPFILFSFTMEFKNTLKFIKESRGNKK